MNKKSVNGARKHTSVGDWTLVLDDDCNASLLGSPDYVLFEAGYEYQGKIEPIYVSIESSDDGSFHHQNSLMGYPYDIDSDEIPVLAHIQSDKPVYKSNDVMFVEVYFFDPVTKKPLIG